MSEKFRGWTVKQAIARCVDDALLKERQDSFDAWAAIGFPTRHVRGGGWLPRDEDRDLVDRGLANTRIHDEYRHWDRAVLDSLRKHLCGDASIATGRQGSPTAEAKVFPGSAWSMLKLRWNGQATEPDGTPIYDVRIYPALLAPEIPELLDGWSLQKVLQKLVYEDPQVARSRKRAVGRGLVVSNFGNNFLGRRAVWPVNYSWESELRSPVGCLGRGHGFVRLANAHLARRFGNLISLFADEKVTICGLENGQPPISSVPGVLWRHKDIFVDIDTGDLLRLDRSAEKLELLYAALTVTRMPASAIASQVASIIQFPKSAQQSSSAKAVAECRNWLVGEMRKSPLYRPKPKAAYFNAARVRWGGKLSGRGFQSAWAEAVRIADAPAWSAPGAPRKTASK